MDSTPSEALAAAEAGRGIVKLTGPQSVADPRPAHISPAIRELGVERVVDAAKNLRALELNGHFETPAWWQEMGRLRDAVDDLTTLDRALTKRGA